MNTTATQNKAGVIKEVSMQLGTVKWFNNAKGFGFITTNPDVGDIFVHFSQIEIDGYKTLKEGQQVNFQLVESDKGPSAHRVRAA